MCLVWSLSEQKPVTLKSSTNLQAWSFRGKNDLPMEKRKVSLPYETVDEIFHKVIDLIPICCYASRSVIKIKQRQQSKTIKQLGIITNLLRPNTVPQRSI